MNPDDIKVVLLYLKQHNAASISEILKKLDLGYDELGAREFTKFLLEKNLIEPDIDENTFGLNKRGYWLTSDGNIFLLKLIEAEQTDKILTFLKEHPGDFPMREICQKCNIPFSKKFGEKLKTQQLVMTSVSKDHDGESTYKINGSGSQTVLEKNGRFFFNQLFDELNMKPNTSERTQNATTFSFGGDNKGAISVNGPATSTYTESSPQPATKKEDWMDKALKFLKLPGAIVLAIGGIITLYFIIKEFFN